MSYKNYTELQNEQYITYRNYFQITSDYFVLCIIYWVVNLQVAQINMILLKMNFFQFALINELCYFCVTKYKPDPSKIKRSHQKILVMLHLEIRLWK